MEVTTEAAAGATHPQGQLMWTKAPGVSHFQTALCGGWSAVVADGPSQIPEEKWAPVAAGSSGKGQLQCPGLTCHRDRFLGLLAKLISARHCEPDAQ